jgi:hypothetical protein
MPPRPATPAEVRRAAANIVRLDPRRPFDRGQLQHLATRHPHQVQLPERIRTAAQAVLDAHQADTTPPWLPYRSPIDDVARPPSGQRRPLTAAQVALLTALHSRRDALSDADARTVRLMQVGTNDSDGVALCDEVLAPSLARFEAERTAHEATRPERDRTLPPLPPVVMTSLEVELGDAVRAESPALNESQAQGIARSTLEEIRTEAQARDIDSVRVAASQLAAMGVARGPGVAGPHGQLLTIVDDREPGTKGDSDGFLDLTPPDLLPPAA